MKPETVHVNACNLLNNTKVAIRIKQLQEEAAKIAKEKFKVDSESILRHLTILSNARIDEYVKFVYEKVDTGNVDDDGKIIYKEIPKLIFKTIQESFIISAFHKYNTVITVVGKLNVNSSHVCPSIDH